MVMWYWIENSIFQECNGICSIALFASAIVLYVLFHCTLCVFDKSHPSKCFGERWNVPFNLAIASLNGTFDLSPHENILTLSLIIVHYSMGGFNPTKISLHPSYFVWKSLTQSLMSNPCRSSLRGAACIPLEIFLPLLLKIWKSARLIAVLHCSIVLQYYSHDV
jgi:hypothetical protein